MRDHRLCILFLAVFVSVLGLTIIFPLIPTHMREMGEIGFGIGLLSGSQSAGTAATPL